MNANKSILCYFCGVIVLTVLLCGCSSTGYELVAASTDETAEGTVFGFYDRYINYAGDPLAERVYQTNSALAMTFINQVDEQLHFKSRGSYDPFLCAQDRPSKFSVLSDSQTIDGTGAIVLVHEVWDPDRDCELTKDIKVMLEIINGHWQITGIDCAGSSPISKSIRINSASNSPSDVVQAFYDWYLAYFRNPVTGEIFNPNGEAAYRSSVYLSVDFVQWIDDLIARNHEKYGFIPADPFLCAQDIPEYIQVEDSKVVSGREAHVVVTSSFPNHQFTVDLQPIDGKWRIVDIHCGQ